MLPDSAIYADSSGYRTLTFLLIVLKAHLRCLRLLWPFYASRTAL